jgi:hypothetical protein
VTEELVEIQLIVPTKETGEPVSPVGFHRVVLTAGSA